MVRRLDRGFVLSGEELRARLDRLEGRPAAGGFLYYDSRDNKTILRVVRDVFRNPDEAVRRYTRKFDGVDLSAAEFKVSKDSIKRAYRGVAPELLQSFRKAIGNVRQYQGKIFIGRDRKCSPSTAIRYIPVRKVGICVPGAAAPLPSTVIMTAVPALVAGVRPEGIVVVSPPRYNQSIHPVTLAVCCELGLYEVYRVGGAQAVAALACGEGTIPKVDMIVGPGNKYVQSAKKMVSGDYVRIDSVAGPSEVLIIADDSATPAWIAADMLAQAEHGQDSIVIVLTSSYRLAKAVVGELQRQLGNLSRPRQALRSLTDLGMIGVVKDIDEAVSIANNLACEHLEIQCGRDSRRIAQGVVNAGAIFVGRYSPVAVGDYWAGPSHTLPTGRTARFSSALTSNDFVRSTSIIEYDRSRLAESAEDIIRLAMAEGLAAHANSIKVRQQGR